MYTSEEDENTINKETSAEYDHMINQIKTISNIYEKQLKLITKNILENSYYSMEIDRKICNIDYILRYVNFYNSLFNSSEHIEEYIKNKKLYLLINNISIRITKEKKHYPQNIYFVHHMITIFHIYYNLALYIESNEDQELLTEINNNTKSLAKIIIHVYLMTIIWTKSDNKNHGPITLDNKFYKINPEILSEINQKESIDISDLAIKKTQKDIIDILFDFIDIANKHSTKYIEYISEYTQFILSSTNYFPINQNIIKSQNEGLINIINNLYKHFEFTEETFDTTDNGTLDNAFLQTITQESIKDTYFHESIHQDTSNISEGLDKTKKLDPSDQDMNVLKEFERIFEIQDTINQQEYQD